MTEDKVRTKKYLRSARGIKVGDRFRYISTGFQVSDNEGTYTISKGAEYDAEVIQTTQHLIVMKIKIDQTCLPKNRPRVWDSEPYTWSIRKVDVGVREKLFLYV